MQRQRPLQRRLSCAIPAVKLYYVPVRKGETSASRAQPGDPCGGRHHDQGPTVAEELMTEVTAAQGARDGSAGHWPAHFSAPRPERSWPHPPEPAAIDLVAPPSQPDDGSGRWT